MAELRSGSRKRRWRRRLVVIAAILLALYAALWAVRLLREIKPASPHPFFDSGPTIIAHRPATFGEHNLASYRDAIIRGADVLELDVRLSRDGKVVVAHDRDLERVFGVSGVVAEMTWAEIVRVTKQPPPLLADVIRRFPGVRLNVELKDDSEALAEAVAALVRGRENILVASFHGDVLDRFRALAPEVATAASSTEALRFYLCYLLDVPSHPEYEALQLPVRAGKGWASVDLSSPALIAFAHRHGLAVHYWTVNDPALIARLFDRGADGVMTDRVAEARRALDRGTLEVR